MGNDPKERARGIHFVDAHEGERRYERLLRGGASLTGAVDAPRRLAHYGSVSDLQVLAARLLHAVTQAHALVDGNKRASISLADEFLVLNGHHLAGSEDDLFALAYDPAAGLGDEEVTRARIATLLHQGKPDAPFEARYPQVIDRLATS